LAINDEEPEIARVAYRPAVREAGATKAVAGAMREASMVIFMV
jgi:hypothetical protein